MSILRPVWATQELERGLVYVSPPLPRFLCFFLCGAPGKVTGKPRLGSAMGAGVAGASHAVNTAILTRPGSEAQGICLLPSRKLCCFFIRRYKCCRAHGDPFPPRALLVILLLLRKANGAFVFNRKWCCRLLQKSRVNIIPIFILAQN